MPSIEGVFDTPQGSAYFTTVDMSWRFYQLPLEPMNQNYTTIRTFFGSLK